MKVGGDVNEDIDWIKVICKVLKFFDLFVVDVNMGWICYEVVCVVGVVFGLDVYVE